MVYNQRIAMTSVIIKGGNIISIGHNKYSRLSYPWKNINGYSRYSGLHAEMDAIRKCYGKPSLKNATMIVYGITKAGNRVLSKPCKACLNAMKAVGIKKIIYFDKIGTKITEKIW